MLFAVDAHAIGRRLTGNEVYIRSLLQALAGAGEGWDLIAYVSQSDAASWVPGRFRFDRVSPNPFLRLGWDLPRRLRRDRPALLHVQYTAPVVCPAPVVVSVHDVSFLEHPEYFPRWRARQLRLTVRRTVQRAARILTGSQFSARAIARHYGRDPEDIIVVPNAASAVFRPISPGVAAAYVRARFQIEPPYILTVGDLQPRKNHIGLIRAFAELLRAWPGPNLRLVLAGKETWYGPQVRRAAERSGAGRCVHFTGFVTDEDLLHLYNACELFVFPSYYEGFGLPLLEAMACGKAVACADNSALPEVADAAALLFDPHSIEDMARVMLELLLDRELRARMERLGLQRAAQFCWHRTAGRTLEVYQAVAAEAASLPAPSRAVSASHR